MSLPLVVQGPPPPAVATQLRAPAAVDESTYPSAPGFPKTGSFPATAEVTKAVVAIWVVLVPPVAVGAAGVPVNVGEASGALTARPEATKAVVAICVVLVPPVAVGAAGVPVKVGEASGALPLKAVQSAALSAPRLEAEAVGTLSVMTGVEVPVATLEDRSAPVVPSVKAATLVTVPLPLALKVAKSEAAR